MSGRGAQGAPPGTTAKAGRGDAKHHHQQHRKGPQRFTPRNRFEGWCAELKGQIYDLKPIGQSDTYMKTTKEIGLYVGRSYKDGADTKEAVDKLVIPTLIMPPATRPGWWRNARSNTSLGKQGKEPRQANRQPRDEYKSIILSGMGPMYRCFTSKGRGRT